MADTHHTPDPAEATPQAEAASQTEAAPQAEAPAVQEKKKKPGAFGADVYTWLQALVVALTALLLLFTFFGRIIGVDGHSMDPSLNHGPLPEPRGHALPAVHRL